ADDTPNNETAFPAQGKLGCGPQIRLYDPTMIANPRFIDFIKKTVKADKLNAQYAVRSSGGTDAGSVHLSDSGVPTVVLGIPTRYIHSHTSVINVNDIDDTVRLTLRLLEKLSARTIASF
ncbi:MAG TPA: M20/M25/M40 family metallo-hydrolase, partial [Candidatus Wallbacteria bacterium]|nr:M20/M25/M40 family metallo-hydrolase [Candidatus Wallbacteria bacterium]